MTDATGAGRRWRRVPTETVLEMGKITLLAGAVEGMIYSVADWLGPEIHGLVSPRRQGADSVRRKLASSGASRAFATAVDIDVTRWHDWLESAGTALSERNRMIHARLVYVSGEDGRVQFARASRDGRKTRRPLHEIVAVREQLESVADEGDALNLIGLVHHARWSRLAELDVVEQEGT
ncbi:MULTISPECIES: hypothetical protein [unclassified Microbacterium]|uniref:hypothetical protein n=1 Tax=unclassified Microbacterium TaxID=2609290 RepID=UPI0028A72736|nr:hypothetical protein [Microbacterium sp.]